MFLKKVEKILKGRLDWIPSTSDANYGWYRSRGVEAKHCRSLETKILLTSPSNVLPYSLKQTFPPII